MRSVRAFLSRLSASLRKQRSERELAEEFESHLAMQIADNLRAGMSPEQARREALLKSGGLETSKESCRERRGLPLVETLLRDFAYALRQVRRGPGFAAVVVLTLALGIGANTAMFSIVHAALLKPLPFRDPARLVLGRCTIGGVINPYVSTPDYYDYREQASDFGGFSAVLPFPQKTTVLGNAGAERATFLVVAHDLFETLAAAPAAGRWFSPEEGRPGAPNVVMVSTHFAQRWFSSPRNAVGASLRMDGELYQVVGVMPATFRFLDDVDAWVPIRRGESFAAAPRQAHMWVIVGRLKPGASIKGAQRQLDVISKRLERQYPASNTGQALQVDPLRAALTEQQTQPLSVLMAAVGLLLLIACANVAGLLLARGSARRQEILMRAALGASRVRLAGQLLVESMTLASLAGILGVALAFWLQRLLPVVVGLNDPGSAPRGMDWQVLLFALAISILTGVLFGVAPALRGSSSCLMQDLASGARTTDTKARVSLRSALVVGQVAVSLMLLIGAGLLIRSFVHLAGVDPGFETRHLLTGEVQLPPAQYTDQNRRIRFFDGLRENLAAIPGVKAVGFTSHLPLRDPLGDYPAWDSDRPPANPASRGTAHRRIVLPGYFDAVRIPLRAGRDLGTNDREHAPLAMVINQQMARTLFPDKDPLGRRVSVDMGGTQPTTFEVVGVVGDVRLNSVGDSAPPTMYLSYYQFPDTTLRFAIRTDQAPASITQSVRKLVLAHDRTVPVENLVSMENLISDSLVPQRTTSIALALFASVALVLACVGLYGVLAYSVSQRTHEIGVRMALGANRGEVLWLVLRQGMTLALAGLAVGMAISFELAHLLESMLFDVAPHDPATFVAVPALLAVVAALACAIPACRAARVDPMVALHYE